MNKFWRFLKKNPIILTFLAIVISFSYAISEVNQVATLANSTAKQREMDSVIGARANCEAINVSTDKLRKVVILATSGSLGLDYTKIPEFEGLPQKSKDFFLALRIRSQTVGNTQAREEFLRDLDIRNCDLEYPLPLQKN